MIKFIKQPARRQDTWPYSAVPDVSTITYEVDSNEETWPELIEHFTHFLRACGYQIKEGAYYETEEVNCIDVYEEEDSNFETTETDSVQETVATEDETGTVQATKCCD